MRTSREILFQRYAYYWCVGSLKVGWILTIQKTIGGVAIHLASNDHPSPIQALISILNQIVPLRPCRTTNCVLSQQLRFSITCASHYNYGAPGDYGDQITQRSFPSSSKPKPRFRLTDLHKLVTFIWVCVSMQLFQATLSNVATAWNDDRRWNARHADSRIARWRSSLLMADRLCNGSRTCMPPRLGLHSCRWSCVGKDQSTSTCNTPRTYWSLAQPYKGTHACRRQVTTALFSQWLWIWAQVSQLWCRYGRRRQWSEEDESKTRSGIWVDWVNASWRKKDWDFLEEA